MATHWASDMGAWDIARGLARAHGAGLVGSRWTRLLIDVNRPVGDPELVRAEADGVALPWNEGLGPDGIERRVRDYHEPYHAEIDRQIARRLLRGVRPVLVSVHTFTPRLGRERRRFDVGLLYVQWPRLAHRLGRELRSAGLEVRYNRPYSGPAGLMYAAHRHGAHHGLPCLEIEVNQERIATSAALKRMTGRLARSLSPVVAGFSRRASDSLRRAT
jgi:predicted N-formylglutamate amidohydrolase